MHWGLFWSSLVALGCSEVDPPEESVVIDDNALLRIKNTTGKSWVEHVAAGRTQVTGFHYEVVFASVPLNVKFDLSELENDRSTGYQALDPGLIKDTNVLHSWSYEYNQAPARGAYVGASESRQAYGQFGMDLELKKNVYHTLELGSKGAKLVVGE